MPPIYYTTALFYPKTTETYTPDQISQRSLLLKQSLSKTLSHYYPLAGKIIDYLSVDCNNEGVQYTEAKANISMVEYLSQPDLTLLPKLVPDVSRFLLNPSGASVLFIQETTFSCGSLVIGLSVSHMVLDGTALTSFIKAWSSISFSSDIARPSFDSPLVYPPCDPFPQEGHLSSLWGSFTRKGKVAARRLIFDSYAITKLKGVAKSSGIENPSRVEVVSAIISKTVRACLNIKSLGITHGVNIRRKAIPQFPDSSVGNFILSTPSVFENNETLGEMAYKIRTAVRKFDVDFVAKISPLTIFEDIKETGNKLFRGEELLSFSSWCNFGLYDCADFGWGKPIWIAMCSRIDSKETLYNNVCILSDTRSGNGVEAWLYLNQDVAATLEKDDYLLQHASIDLSPLSINY